MEVEFNHKKERRKGGRDGGTEGRRDRGRYAPYLLHGLKERGTGQGALRLGRGRGREGGRGGRLLVLEVGHDLAKSVVVAGGVGDLGERGREGGRF